MIMILGGFACWVSNDQLGSSYLLNTILMFWISSLVLFLEISIPFSFTALTMIGLILSAGMVLADSNSATPVEKYLAKASVI